MGMQNKFCFNGNASTYHFDKHLKHNELNLIIVVVIIYDDNRFLVIMLYFLVTMLSGATFVNIHGCFYPIDFIVSYVLPVIWQQNLVQILVLSKIKTIVELVIYI